MRLKKPPERFRQQLIEVRRPAFSNKCPGLSGKLGREFSLDQSIVHGLQSEVRDV
jgi:hypothetical protein